MASPWRIEKNGDESSIALRTSRREYLHKVENFPSSREQEHIRDQQSQSFRPRNIDQCHVATRLEPRKAEQSKQRMRERKANSDSNTTKSHSSHQRVHEHLKNTKPSFVNSQTTDPFITSQTAMARKQAAQAARKPTTTPSRTEDGYGDGDIRDGERKKSRHPRQRESQQQHQAERKTATAMAAYETAKGNEHAAQAIWKPATTQGRAEDGYGGGLYMVFLLLVGVSWDFISGHQCKEQFHKGDSRVN